MNGLAMAASNAMLTAAARADIALRGVAPFQEDGTWFDNRYIQAEFWPKALDTLNMTLLSALFTVLLGLPLGLALVASAPKGLAPNRTLNQVLGAIVNVGRSIPFIILMVMVVPITRAITGTTITWYSAVVPLTIAAVPFFARLVETSLSSVGEGKVEAALMMGASRLRVLWDVLVRESLASLIQNVTVVIVTLIGYTAMAGAIGSGGLGQLAINQGYNRNMYDVMYIAVGGILVMVMVFQFVGDMLSRLVDHSRR
ncbi:MAG TPA: methionine ABC transporter permease [Actinomycetaceae bacterium]|nr:methionine ABC transporter permease [Actinomycetaceae bacterium]